MNRKVAASASPIAGIRLSSEARLCIAIILLALVIRMGGLFLFPHPLTGDAVLYDQLATSIADGHGLTKGAGQPPTAVRGPVYPALIAGSYLLFGHTQEPIYLLQIVSDGVTILLLIRFTTSLVSDQRAGLIAGFLYAIYPPFIEQSVLLYTETLFTFLLFTSLWIFWIATRRNSLRWFALSGLLLGIATLTRPSIFLFPIWLIAGLWPFRQRTGMIRPGATILSIFILVLAPWAARNYRAFGGFVPVSTLSGLNLYQAHVGIDQPDALRARRPSEAISLARQELWDQGIDPDSLNEAQFDRYLQRAALQQIVQHPQQAIVLFFNRFLRFWFNLGYYGSPSRASIALAVGNGILLLGMLLAWIRFRGRWWPWALPPLAVLLYFTLSHMVIHAQVRYSFPVVPYTMIFCAYSLSRILYGRKGTA